jgi:hypothetical protein
MLPACSRSTGDAAARTARYTSNHPLARAAAEIAVTIRRIALNERRVRGVSVLERGSGESRSLVLYYAATTAVSGVPAEYVLTLDSRRGTVESVGVSWASRDEHCKPEGECGEPNYGYEIGVRRTSRGPEPWVARVNGFQLARCRAVERPGEPCSPRSVEEREGEGRTAQVRAEMLALIAAARRHQPVPAEVRLLARK